MRFIHRNGGSIIITNIRIISIMVLYIISDPFTISTSKQPPVYKEKKVSCPMEQQNPMFAGCLAAMAPYICPHQPLPHGSFPPQASRTSPFLEFGSNRGWGG
jgi:hypothetical protein